MSHLLKKRIAVIVPGGIGTGKNNIGVPVLERQVRMLADEFDITVFSLFPVNKDYEPVGFRIVSIRPRDVIRKSVWLWYVFRRHHLEKRFQVIHGFWTLPSGFLAVVLGKLFGVRSIVSVLGGDGAAVPEINYGLLRRSFPRLLIRWTLSHADEAMALTRYLKDNLFRHGLKRELAIVPWGIDTTQFAFQEKSFKSVVNFLHIGNLTPVKDQNTLLRAFQIISKNVEARLVIIGEGTHGEEMRRLITDLDLSGNVTVIQPMPYEQLPNYYQDADVLLHTSLSEGQSEVVTEAMSGGLLVCGTKVGALYDVNDGCIAVAVGDFKELASETIKVLRDPARVAALRANANAWATQHDIHWTVDKTRKIYLGENG
jgi:glycosyltransferase involved in cell wall biosynthesis